MLCFDLWELRVLMPFFRTSFTAMTLTHIRMQKPWVFVGFELLFLKVTNRSPMDISFRLSSLHENGYCSRHNSSTVRSNILGYIKVNLIICEQLNRMIRFKWKWSKLPNSSLLISSDLIFSILSHIDFVCVHWDWLWELIHFILCVSVTFTFNRANQYKIRKQNISPDSKLRTRRTFTKKCWII